MRCAFLETMRAILARVLQIVSKRQWRAKSAGRRKRMRDGRYQRVDAAGSWVSVVPRIMILVPSPDKAAPLGEG